MLHFLTTTAALGIWIYLGCAVIKKFEISQPATNCYAAQAVAFYKCERSMMHEWNNEWPSCLPTIPWQEMLVHMYCNCIIVFFCCSRLVLLQFTGWQCNVADNFPYASAHPLYGIGGIMFSRCPSVCACVHACVRRLLCMCVCGF